MAWILLAAAALAYGALDLFRMHRQRRRLRVLLLVRSSTDRMGRESLESVVREMARMVARTRGGRLFVAVGLTGTIRDDHPRTIGLLARSLPGVRIIVTPPGEDLIVRGMALAGGVSEVTLVFDGSEPLRIWIHNAERLVRSSARLRKEGTGKGKPGVE